MKLLVIFLIILMTYTSVWSFDYGAKNSKLAPTREHAIVVSKEGYYPKHISLFEGEKLKLYLTTIEKEQGCLMIPTHKVFLAANPGRVTSKEVVFKEPGIFKFYCPAGKINGRITVLKRKKKTRKPASVAPRVWMPRDN